VLREKTGWKEEMRGENDFIGIRILGLVRVYVTQTQSAAIKQQFPTSHPRGLV